MAQAFSSFGGGRSDSPSPAFNPNSYSGVARAPRAPRFDTSARPTGPGFNRTLGSMRADRGLGASRVFPGPSGGIYAGGGRSGGWDGGRMPQRPGGYDGSGINPGGMYSNPNPAIRNWAQANPQLWAQAQSRMQQAQQRNPAAYAAWAQRNPRWTPQPPIVKGPPVPTTPDGMVRLDPREWDGTFNEGPTMGIEPWLRNPPLQGLPRRPRSDNYLGSYPGGKQPPMTQKRPRAALPRKTATPRLLPSPGAILSTQSLGLPPATYRR